MFVCLLTMADKYIQFEEDKIILFDFRQLTMRPERFSDVGFLMSRFDKEHNKTINMCMVRRRGTKQATCKTKIAT